MLMTLIQKEMMHHILSARFVALLLMCVLLIPLNLHINYHHYLKRQIDYRYKFLPNHTYGIFHFSRNGCHANWSSEKKHLLPNGYSLLRDT